MLLSAFAAAVAVSCSTTPPPQWATGPGEIAARRSPHDRSRHAAQDGFDLLTDSIENFRAYRGGGDPPPAWGLSEGTLAFTPGAQGGDIATAEQYEDFDLRFQWRVAPGGNSGVMYLSRPGDEAPYHTGPEYQILDNAIHADGASPLTSAGAMYGLYPTDPSAVRPVGQWNDGRIVVKDGHIRHWLNGKLVVEAQIGSDDWASRVTGSKFTERPDFGKMERGHIVFQDHGDPVWYRRIRVKRL